MKIIVLGADLVGNAIIKDLVQEDEYEVLAVDYSQAALDKLNTESTVTTKQADLSEKGVIASLVENYDLVISAVPGFLGFSTLRKSLQRGRTWSIFLSSTRILSCWMIWQKKTM